MSPARHDPTDPAAGRYPSSWGDVDEAEYHDAVRLAEYVVNWADSIVHQR